MGFQIAIDGPAGAGKSTIARQVAKEKGFIYVDTGAMYRAMALFLMRQHIKPEDSRAIAETCEKADISVSYENGEQIIWLNGENVNPWIRTEEVGKMASMSSANHRVRERLLELQKRLAETNDVVMDGRDIGTFVLPGAQVKIFLTADSRIRAERRYAELTAKGIPCDLDDIEKGILRRDHQDMTRELSPLRQAEDAVRVDTSRMDIPQAVTEILNILSQKASGQ